MCKYLDYNLGVVSTWTEKKEQLSFVFSFLIEVVRRVNRSRSIRKEGGRPHPKYSSDWECAPQLLNNISSQGSSLHPCGKN